MFNDETKKLWGFHPMQEAFLNSLRENNSDLVPARVIFSSHDLYKVLILGSDKEMSAKVRGHYYHQNEELPAVGDWVAIELSPGDHQNLPVEATLPRISSLKRQDQQRGFQTLVANIDYVGLVTSFNQDLNQRRLERGLVMIEESGARPIIIINKSDLVENSVAEKQLEEIASRLGEVLMIRCSAHSGEGVDQLTDLFQTGQTVAFIGMSGVGKSTLINSLLNENKLETKGIREEDARGRHTTTYRELFHAEKGFWILDSPGIREFAFAGEDEVLERTFDDIGLLMSGCRFSDCSHNEEPGCQIRAALESEVLPLDRWENYLKIKREMEFHANKNNKAYHSQLRKEHAKRNVALRQRLKAKRNI